MIPPQIHKGGKRLVVKSAQFGMPCGDPRRPDGRRRRLRRGHAATAARGRGAAAQYHRATTVNVAAGTVISQTHRAGVGVGPGTAVGLVIAKAPPPRPTSPPAPSNCDPSYPGVCLHPGIGDYDCAGGSGNGPNYVDGPIRVRPPDPFGLDSDGDGWGCES